MSDYGEIVEHGTVRFQRLLPGPIERVWRYLTESELRSTWFAAGDMDLRVGGELKYVFHQTSFAPDEAVPERYRREVGYSFVGRITRCEPPSVLAYRWDDSEVIFELEPRGSEVQLTLTHRKLAGRKEMVDVSGGWHVHLGVLRSRLIGAPVERFWTDVERYDLEYEARIPR
jgi:uncharacterized protein YndB with AHSA1/START domain